jgi:acyl-coenzyme A synthetase/AMP-(fatty) acid ligase/thioesterase domain-containing protein/acyl carrier protein
VLSATRPFGPDVDLRHLDGPAICVPRAFRQVVARHATNVSVLDGQLELTYAQLDERANRVAAAILRHDAPGPEPVLVLTDHTTDAVVSMLGIAKSGHPYLMLDPHAPEAHRTSVADRFPSSIVLADSANLAAASRLPRGHRPLHLDALPPGPDPGLELDPRAALAISFTSGTSGTPKAVVHDHRNVVLNARRVGAAIAVTHLDRLLVSSPFAFVASATPAYVGLLSGAAVCPYDFTAHGTEGFAEFAARAGLTVAQLPPAVLPALARHARPSGQGVTSVRLAMTGGDRLEPAHLRDVHRVFPRARLLHRYNTSETNWIAGAWIDPSREWAGQPIPLGWPVPWVHVRSVDATGVEVAAGETGELVVRSDSLALGYLGDEAQTRGRFIHSAEGLEFWTRDRVRIQPGGCLEFVGRSDTTTKVRGVLVDLSSVEHAIATFPDVTAAVVVAVPSDRGGTRLAAFVTGGHLRPRDIRRHVADRLPAAMVPATIDQLLELPLTARGKVDRMALIGLAEAAPRGDGDPPRDGVEAELAACFGSILALDDVTRDGDFFALGGDSLASVELLTVLEDRFGAHLVHSDLLECPTPALLAERLGMARRSSQRSDSHLIRVTAGRPGSVPIVLFSGGGGGNFEGMAQLARALPQRTCYVVVPRAFEYRGRPDRTIAAMAASVVADFREQLGGGPVALVGYSSGGHTAIAVAGMILGSGGDVTLVALLDTLALTDVEHRRMRLRSRVGRVPAEVRAIRAGRGETTSLLRQAIWVVRVTSDQVRRRVLARSAGLVPRSGDRQRDAFQALMKTAMLSHRDGPHAGPVLLVRADGSGEDAARSGLTTLHWNELLTGDLSTVVVPAGHEDMVKQPTLARVAGEVLAALARYEAPPE